ncbi:MAG: hypothetical protein SWJ54_01500 [Cyanobacteriota bacterium]|nr:hypothetical protein [Cyanobacteriota bacterium]
MNALWLRMLKSSYRKEPIVSFIITIGAVNAVIGGVGASWSLLSFGLGTVGVAMVLRWWQSQRFNESSPETVAEYSLPPSPSRQPLPPLASKRKRPPY